MSRTLRAALAGSALLLAGLTTPAGAAGAYAEAGVVDAVFLGGDIAVPGGKAYVHVLSFRYEGASGFAGAGAPSVGPDQYREAFGCVGVTRGKRTDSTCAEISPGSLTVANDLQRGTAKFTVPTPKGSISVDLTFTAFGDPEPNPDYRIESFYGPVTDTYASASLALGRESDVSGTVTSTYAGGGKASAQYAWIEAERWLGGYSFAYP